MSQYRRLSCLVGSGHRQSRPPNRSLLSTAISPWSLLTLSLPKFPFNFFRFAVPGMSSRCAILWPSIKLCRSFPFPLSDFLDVIDEPEVLCNVRPWEWWENFRNLKSDRSSGRLRVLRYGVQSMRRPVQPQRIADNFGPLLRNGG
jgi:hypothetical protein